MFREKNPVLVISIAMSNSRPWVQVACLCEAAIMEATNVATLVRIADTYTGQIPSNVPPGIKPMMQMTVYVSVKSGDVTGSHQLGLRLQRPEKKEPNQVQWWPVVLNGGTHGANFQIKMTLLDPHEGLHRFDVLWNTEDDPLTSIPFMVKLEPEKAETAKVSNL